MKIKTTPLFFIGFLFSLNISAQENTELYDIIDKVSSERIEKDITKLVSFGTRNHPEHRRCPTGDRR